MMTMHLHKSRRHLKYISEHLLRSLVSSKGPVPDAIVMRKVLLISAPGRAVIPQLLRARSMGWKGVIVKPTLTGELPSQAWPK